MRLQRTRFRVGRRAKAVAAAKPRRGTALRFTASEAAWVRIDVRELRGRRTRTVVTVTRHVPSGPARIALTGRFRDGGRTIVLRPGRYRVAIRATDHAGNDSRRRARRFRVVR